MEMEKGLGEEAQAAQPHLGRREGVHPADDAHAAWRGVRVGAESRDRIRGRQNRLGYDAERNARTSPQFLGDLAGVSGNRFQGLTAVQMLAARDKPKLHRFKIDHRSSKPPTDM